jgi:hypothetical protein
MKPNRIRPHADKKSPSKQVPNAAENGSGKTLASSPGKSAADCLRAADYLRAANWIRREIRKASTLPAKKMIPRLKELLARWEALSREVNNFFSEQTEEKPTVPQGTKHPVACEPILEKAIADLTLEERRELAHVYERWAIQLFASNDLIEQLNAGKGDAETCKPCSHSLVVAAELEKSASEMRRRAGVRTHKPDAVTRLLALSNN